MMEAVDAVNERAEARCWSARSATTSAASCAGKTVAVWGLAFKPKTDDIREAPALVLIDALLEAGVARCASTTPRPWPTSGAIYGDRLVYCDRPYGALEGADALAIVTEWNEFRNPDFEVMRRLHAPARSSSTAATSTTRRGWPRWASSTTASAVPRPRSPRPPRNGPSDGPRAAQPGSASCSPRSH